MAALRNPDVVHGMLEDYRAGLTVGRAAVEEDRVNDRKIEPPLLVVWSTRDDIQQLYGDLVDVWRPWAHDVHGVSVESGHHPGPNGTGTFNGVIDHVTVRLPELAEARDFHGLALGLLDGPAPTEGRSFVEWNDFSRTSASRLSH